MVKHKQELPLIQFLKMHGRRKKKEQKKHQSSLRSSIDCLQIHYGFPHPVHFDDGEGLTKMVK